MPALADYVGRLWITWGSGYRHGCSGSTAHAGKPVVELRRSFSEDAFPGFDALILNLADIETIPIGCRSRSNDRHRPLHSRPR